MKIELKPLEGCKRQLDIEIPGDIVGREIDSASEEMARRVRVPGFRPGRVPRSVIKKRFKQELQQEALRNLLPSAVETAVEQHHLRIVDQPAINALDFGDDDRLTFSVSFEVFPEFAVGNFRGLPVTRKVYKVTDADVARVIDGLREDAAELVADDAEGREARDGDIVSVDLEGTYVEGEEGHHHHHEPLKVDDVSIEIGGKGVLAEFSDNLRGMKVSEAKTFRVDYPADFSDPRLANHTLEYTARVAAIRVKEVPEFDDEFVSEHGGGAYETAEAMRAGVRESLERQAKAREASEFEDAVVDRLLEQNQFPVPEVMVEEQAKMRLEGMLRQMKAHGADPRRLNLDWKALHESARRASERDVRSALIVDRIAETERIEASDEDVEAEFERVAQSVGQPTAQVKARLTKDRGADSIRNQVRHRKVLDLVAQSAQATVEEVEGLGTEADEMDGERRGDEGSPSGQGE